MEGLAEHLIDEAISEVTGASSRRWAVPVLILALVGAIVGLWVVRRRVIADEAAARAATADPAAPVVEPVRG